MDHSSDNGLAFASELYSTSLLAHRIISTEAACAMSVLEARDQKALEVSTAAMAKKLARHAEQVKKQEEKYAKDCEAAIKAGKLVPKAPDVSALKDATPKGIRLGFGTQKFRSFLGAQPVSKLNQLLDPFAEKPYGTANHLEELLASSNQKSKPKIPKGTKDTEPESMAVQEKAFGIIRRVFRRHGAVGIDTPVFELKDTLMGKYGEDSKLIFDLADQGGEILSLRYDLTVPFARYVASHGITNIKRYHMAKVYRRDQPQMQKGRFREFYQCDFDIAGVYPPMIPDAEVLKVLSDILSDLNIGGFKIKLSHRELLDALMDVSGVPEDLFRPICSAVDKLDKMAWADVKREMVVDKGLSESAADILGTYVASDQFVGLDSLQLLERLSQDAKLAAHEKAQRGLADMRLLFAYLQAMNCLQHVSFDLSLARGLNYYTGLIYEAVLTDTDRVGSIAAGGRYDKLVGMFSTQEVPAVGVSIGVGRLLAILEEAERKRATLRQTATQVYVASVGDGLLTARMEICRDLWQAGVATEFMYHLNPKSNKQLGYVLENSIPIMVWTGEDEVKNGVVQLKVMDTKEQRVVPRAEIVAAVKHEIDMLKQAGPRPLPVFSQEVSEAAKLEN